jgi:hypothetical protein
MFVPSVFCNMHKLNRTNCDYLEVPTLNFPVCARYLNISSSALRENIISDVIPIRISTYHVK